MIASLPASLPAPHREFLASACETLAHDPRISGVAAGGSYLSDSMDEFSDLDLIIAIDPAAHAAVMDERRTIADSLGPLLTAFTAEHVGDDRLLICLYGPPLLHVDLKFLALPELAERVEDPAIVWERDGVISTALDQSTAKYPKPDPQWIEDRFWTWIHYAALKVGRGELFEAHDCLSYFRSSVLGPLALAAAGARPQGVRRLETLAPKFANRLRATVADYDAAACLAALRTCADLYRDLRASIPEIEIRHQAERAALEFLEEINPSNSR